MKCPKCGNEFDTDHRGKQYWNGYLETIRGRRLTVGYTCQHCKMYYDELNEDFVDTNGHTYHLKDGEFVEYTTLH